MTGWLRFIGTENTLSFRRLGSKRLTQPIIQAEVVPQRDPTQGTRFHIMDTKSVQQLLDDVRLLGGEQISIVQTVRSLVKETIPSVTEEVKYGGILFSSGVMFSGVFAYKMHVSVEFSCGAKIRDTLGHLEGSGKGRRHIKLYSARDIEAKELACYLPLALEAARSGS